MFFSSARSALVERSLFKLLFGNICEIHRFFSTCLLVGICLCNGCQLAAEVERH